MNYLVPTIQSETLFDGGVLHAPNNCFVKYNKKTCADFYSTIKRQKEGFYVCPSGYSVYLEKRLDDSCIYCGMLIKKYYNKNKIKTNDNENNCIAISEKLFFEILKEQGKYLEIQTKEEQNRELNRDLLHDVRKVDSLIKSKAEAIVREYENKDVIYKEIVQRVKNIGAMEELIACKYSVYDLASNIDVLLMGQKSSVNIYKKFDKVRYILTGYRNKGVGIDFIGETTYEYEINFSYSDILPFLLLENAVKYTIGDHNVEVHFEEYNSSLYVTIKSFGPFCEDDEIDMVFERNYRGRNTQKHTTEGTGLGLYLVRQICDLCNVDISISSDYVKEFNGIRCGYFKVVLIF